MNSRSSARALVVGPSGRVLLVRVRDARIVDPERPRPPDFWTTLGGGLEPGETFETAALREITEETGLVDVVLGPQLWERSVTLLVDGVPQLQQERYFVAWSSTEHLEDSGQTDTEREVFRGFRWWTAAGIRTSSDTFAPEEIPGLVLRAIEATPEGR